mmetsp:Transcript_27425/g.69779  ORF Transcript_27425/g.69779 Transcript_27425/m.69779 type:complete len:239 (+) Transcript_27425:2-718(+)
MIVSMLSPAATAIIVTRLAVRQQLPQNVLLSPPLPHAGRCPGRVTTLAYDAIVESTIGTEQIAVVKFGISGCRGCMGLAPKYERLARDWPEADFFVIDYKQNGRTFKDLGVRVLPHMHIIRGGILRDSFLCPPSKISRLEEAIHVHSQHLTADHQGWRQQWRRQRWARARWWAVRPRWLGGGGRGTRVAANAAIAWCRCGIGFWRGQVRDACNAFDVHGHESGRESVKVTLTDVEHDL